MVFPFDVTTGAELTNTAFTENGFYLDLAKSRYLDIDIQREVLMEGADGLTEDVRFNRPAQDGSEYTEEGIYTITVRNRYTNQTITKIIYVGTNEVLKSYAATGLPISEILDQLAAGATIAEDGTIIQPESTAETSAEITSSSSETEVTNGHTQPPSDSQSEFHYGWLIAVGGVILVLPVVLGIRHKMHVNKTGHSTLSEEGDEQ